MKINHSSLCMFFALTNFYFFCVLDSMLSLWIAILMIVCARINIYLEQNGDGF